MLILTILAVPSVSSAQGAPRTSPPGWKSRLLNGGPDTTAQIWVTPGGWHVTTTDNGLWWDTTMVEKKAFSVSLEATLLPGAARNGFGMFVGGRDLEKQRPAYLTFQIRPDGRFLVGLHEGREEHGLVPWMYHPAITTTAGEVVTYRLRLEVHPLRLDYFVNDVKVHSMSRATVRAEGVMGLKLDAGLDLEVSEFKVVPIR